MWLRQFLRLYLFLIGGWTFLGFGTAAYGQQPVPQKPIPVLPPEGPFSPEPNVGPNFGSQQENGRPQKRLTVQEVRTLTERLHKESIAGYLKAKCFACHSDAKVTAGLNLQRLPPDFVTAAPAESWRRVYERMRDHEMPPQPKTEPAKPEAAKPEAVKDARPLPPMPFSPVPQPAPNPHEEAVYAISKAEAAARHLRPYATLEVPPLAIGGGESTVRRLQTQKRNSLAELLTLRNSLASWGRISLEEVVVCNQELTRAELVLTTAPEQRLNLLRRQLEFARQLEDNCYGRYQAGAANAGDFYAAKDARLAAQIELQQALEK